MDAPLIASGFMIRSRLGLQSSIQPLDAASYLLWALMESEDRCPIRGTSSRLGHCRGFGRSSQDPVRV